MKIVNLKFRYLEGDYVKALRAHYDYGTRQFTVIPKRVFCDSAEREVFEGLLDKNIPQVVYKKIKFGPSSLRSNQENA